MTEPALTPPPGCPAHADAAPLYGPRFQTDPSQVYQELRERYGPVAPVEVGGGVPAWLVLGYRELQLVTGRPKLFGRDSKRWNAWPDIPEDWPLTPMVAPLPSMLYTEGEEHRRRAGAVTDALAGVDPYEVRKHCEEVADRLVDGFSGRGECDLVAEYADRLPLLVLCRIFGIDEDETPVLIRSILDVLDGGPAALDAQHRMARSMIDLVAAKHENPGADVPSRMLAHPAGLTDEELMRDLTVLMVAGHQPTANWISNALRLMLTDDRFASALSGGRRSVSQALSEVLWEDTPTQIFAGRWATGDTQLGGRRIAAGDMVLLGLAAANQDPAVRGPRAAPPRATTRT